MYLTRITVFVAALLAAPVAMADKLPLSDISAYLNGIRTAQGSFTQINDDGSIATGTLFIKRPGRVRFEYDPPEAALVMAGGGEVAIFDLKSNQGPERYPLNRTPLSIILAKNVDLGRARMVVGHAYDGTATTVTAQDPEHPDYGNIQLKFTGAPVELRQWIINDASGSRTTVILGELTRDIQLGERMFRIDRETESDER